jgi:hypothetical protein
LVIQGAAFLLAKIGSKVATGTETETETKKESEVGAGIR